jgi:SpoVK/Ycf46/Vps4 family AAA+-type ATPase
VLLLDEADVFLSKRTQDGLKRNALVSVFLRAIDYYQGVLFLTTNRVTEFDPAFQSRIHLAVKYEALSTEQRTLIWRGLLSAFEETRDWSDEFYDTIGKELVLNGREIKNLIETSHALASRNGLHLTEGEMLLTARLIANH